MRRLSLLTFLLSVAWSVASAQVVAPEPKSDTEARNMETMRLWGEEVWGKGRLELVPDLVAPQYIRHNADGSRTVTPEGYALEIAENRDRNMIFETNAIAIDGNLLWTRWSGSVEGPDGQEVTLKGIQIYRFADGKLAETWNLSAIGDHWPDN